MVSFWNCHTRTQCGVIILAPRTLPCSPSSLTDLLPLLTASPLLSSCLFVLFFRCLFFAWGQQMSFTRVAGPDRYWGACFQGLRHLTNNSTTFHNTVHDVFHGIKGTSRQEDQRSVIWQPPRGSDVQTHAMHNWKRSETPVGSPFPVTLSVVMNHTSLNIYTYMFTFSY